MNRLLRFAISAMRTEICEPKILTRIPNGGAFHGDDLPWDPNPKKNHQQKQIQNNIM